MKWWQADYSDRDKCRVTAEGRNRLYRAILKKFYVNERDLSAGKFHATGLGSNATWQKVFGNSDDKWLTLSIMRSLLQICECELERGDVEFQKDIKDVAVSSSLASKEPTESSAEISRPDKQLLAIHIPGQRANWNNINESKDISILSISMRGGLDYISHLKTAIQDQGAKVRILLLATNSPFIFFRECQEVRYTLEDTNRIGKISTEASKTLSQFNALAVELKEENDRRTLKRGKSEPSYEDGIKGSLEVRVYDELPYFGCVITENLVQYYPYFVNLRSGLIPTYDVNPASELADYIKTHFDLIWDTEGSTKIVCKAEAPNWNVYTDSGEFQNDSQKTRQSV